MEISFFRALRLRGLRLQRKGKEGVGGIEGRGKEERERSGGKGGIDYPLDKIVDTPMNSRVVVVVVV